MQLFTEIERIILFYRSIVLYFSLAASCNFMTHKVMILKYYG